VGLDLKKRRRSFKKRWISILFHRSGNTIGGMINYMDANYLRATAGFSFDYRVWSRLSNVHLCFSAVSL